MDVSSEWRVFNGLGRRCLGCDWEAEANVWRETCGLRRFHWRVWRQTCVIGLGVGTLGLGLLGLLRTSTRALGGTQHSALRRPRPGPGAHRGWRRRGAAALPRGGAPDRGARVLLQAEQRFLGAVRTGRLGGADGAARRWARH